MSSMKKNKISRFSKGLTLFIVLAGLAAVAAGTVLYQVKGVSEFTLLQDSVQGRILQRTMDDFEVGWQYDAAKGAEQLYLVAVKKKLSQYIDGAGNTDGMLSWNVRTGDRFEIPLWNKSEQATELNVHGMQPVLVTGLSGCCAEMTGYRLYNYKNGTLLMSFNDFDYEERTTQPFSLEVPNTEMAYRYIGLISQDSTRDRDFVKPAPGQTAAVLLKYANERLKQKIQVEMSAAPGYGISVMEVAIERDPSAPKNTEIEINGKQVVLWNIDGVADPAQISGVQLKVVLNGGEGDKTLIIPVKNDQLDLTGARFSPGLSINAL